VIDIHCHILPGLDDGPANIDFSIAMARAAVADGTQLIVATPHIRRDFDVDPEAIAPAVNDLNMRLGAEDVRLRVLPGAEVGWREVAELDARTLGRLCLGDSGYLLVECPYGSTPADLEGVLAEVHQRGLKAVLAHPERCPLFQKDIDRLAALVADGALVSITAASVSGGFGERVQEFTFDLLERRLVHDVASDAHDHLHRPPRLGAALSAAEDQLPGISEHASWFTVTAPVAILRGDRPDDVPRLARARRGGWRRVLRPRSM
jgi:protein-tyrosine phosphatase